MWNVTQIGMRPLEVVRIKEHDICFKPESYKPKYFEKLIVNITIFIFLSMFLKALCCPSGSKLAFSSAYHPWSHGQSEVVNHSFEMYLLCLSGYQLQQWVDWILWLSIATTALIALLVTTPFQLVYRRKPSRLLSYSVSPTKIETVDKALQEREAVLQSAHDRLLRA